MKNGFNQWQAPLQRQKQSLSQAQRQAIALLSLPLPDLRAAVDAEVATNPALEGVDHPLEETSLAQLENRADREGVDGIDYYPEDGYTDVRNFDEEAAERRQALFDRQVGQETLQQHLVAQLPLSRIPRADFTLAETLIGDLGANGFYEGSVPDMQMAFGRSETEILDVLRKIGELDPPGCGARTARECLQAQLDKLDGNPARDDVRTLVERHLPDLAAGRFDEICRAGGMTRARLDAARAALLTLDASPGRAFPSERDRVEYVNPEVHAVRGADGRWIALTDRRSMPTLRFSSRLVGMMRDPNLKDEDRAYLQEKIAAARELQEAIEWRQSTVEAVAQAVFDRQPDFFTKGFAALKPLTEAEIAAVTGRSASTVSRTVSDKYAKTPFGVVALRRFFVTEVRTAKGDSFAQTAAVEALKDIVAAEDPADPLSDGRLVEALKGRGYDLARRTVVKYRTIAGIPTASERRRKDPVTE